MYLFPWFIRILQCVWHTILPMPKLNLVCLPCRSIFVSVLLHNFIMNSVRHVQAGEISICLQHCILNAKNVGYLTLVMFFFSIVCVLNYHNIRINGGINANEKNLRNHRDFPRPKSWRFFFVHHKMERYLKCTCVICKSVCLSIICHYA